MDGDPFASSQMLRHRADDIVDRAVDRGDAVIDDGEPVEGETCPPTEAGFVGKIAIPTLAAVLIFAAIWATVSSGSR